MRATLILLVAQGFGSGRVPFAPGTFGTLVGIPWFLLLVLTGNIYGFVGGILLSFFLSVWLCGEAEKILGKTDPGSVVLDEITAMPVCFLPWVISLWQHHHSWPGVAEFFQGTAWIKTLGLFALFRLFDIWKPPPIRQTQDLPGGWGVTVDDFVAAALVAAISLLFVR